MAIPLLFILRFALTIVSYGTGAAGGIFSPLLVLGALLGLGFGHVAHYLAPAMTAEPALFAVVGMAAYFTAIVRAPLTGILLITEMTGSYEQMLPLAGKQFLRLRDGGVFTVAADLRSLLERDLKRGGGGHMHAEPIVVEFEVEIDAPFAGKVVRELGLPARLCFSALLRAGTRVGADGEHALGTHMRVTAVIAPEAEGALESLRAGCAAQG